LKKHKKHGRSGYSTGCNTSGDLKSKIWSKIQQEQNLEEEKTLSQKFLGKTSGRVRN
jgi:hypothetical protein